MKLPPLGSKLFNVGEQADMLKPIAGLPNFANVTKMGQSHPNCTLPLGLVQDLSPLPFPWF
jgi:hypothetical protein